MKKQGFTLIELLVVIAIIAILAAILFPVFANAKEHAKQTKCLNNLKQLTFAFRNYCDDYNGIMPNVICQDPWYDWAGSLTQGALFHVKDGQIWPYVKNSETYLCPSDSKQPALSIAGQPTNYEISYSLNYQLGSAYVTNAYNTGLTNLDTATAGRTSKILMLIHEDRERINGPHFYWKGNYDVPSKVHYDGTTVSYADGHCKWANHKQLTIEKNNNQWQSNLGH